MLPVSVNLTALSKRLNSTWAQAVSGPPPHRRESGEGVSKNEGQSLALDARTDDSHDVLQESMKWDERGIQLQFAGFDFGKIENVR